MFDGSDASARKLRPDPSRACEALQRTLIYLAAIAPLLAEFGYGFQRPKGAGLWTPFLATESGGGHATYRLGLRLDSPANAEAAFEFARRENLGGLHEHELRLQGRVRW